MKLNPYSSLQPVFSLAKGEENSQTKVLFELFLFGRDLLLTISGGEAHIGAISLSDGLLKHSIGLQDHKELPIATQVLQELRPNLKPEILILCGIHYDHISKESIQSILAHCKDLTLELKKQLPTILGLRS